MTPGWPKANGGRIKMTMRIAALRGQPVSMGRGWQRNQSLENNCAFKHRRESEQDDVGSRAAWGIPRGQNEGRLA